MRKIMYNRALFILHKKNVKLSHFHDVIEKEVFDSHSYLIHTQKKIISWFRKSKLFDRCFFTRKLNFFIFSYSTLKTNILFYRVP